MSTSHLTDAARDRARVLAFLREAPCHRGGVGRRLISEELELEDYKTRDALRGLRAAGRVYFVAVGEDGDTWHGLWCAVLV